jgi:hypothetical protein
MISIVVEPTPSLPSVPFFFEQPTVAALIASAPTKIANLLIVRIITLSSSGSVAKSLDNPAGPGDPDRHTVAPASIKVRANAAIAWMSFRTPVSGLIRSEQDATIPPNPRL